MCESPAYNTATLPATPVCILDVVQPSRSRHKFCRVWDSVGVLVRSSNGYMLLLISGKCIFCRHVNPVVFIYSVYLGIVCLRLIWCLIQFVLFQAFVAGRMAWLKRWDTQRKGRHCGLRFRPLVRFHWRKSHVRGCSGNGAEGYSTQERMTVLLTNYGIVKITQRRQDIFDIHLPAFSVCHQIVI
jgi:hypothetical protein